MIIYLLLQVKLISLKSHKVNRQQRTKERLTEELVLKIFISLMQRYQLRVVFYRELLMRIVTIMMT